jgi:alkaline phosphatase D
MSIPLYRLFDSHRTNRRSFILATSSLAAAAVWSTRAFGVVARQVALPAYPFALGVASGDPTEDGFVLWTRLAPRPLEGGGMPHLNVEVAWQVAEDEQMTRVVQRGTTVAKPDWAHSVHVEVEGLRPDRWYWYQFKVGQEVSPKGRSRTLPLAKSLPERLRFSFISCNHYEHGHFTAFDHLCREDNDLIIHLGDYIYEGGIAEKAFRKHNSREIFTLQDYRNRYAQYQTDPLLQAAHAAAPWLVTWDDHEVDNNYANLIPEEKSVEKIPLRQRRAHAYKAFYEHMPLRRAQLPDGPDLKLFRRVPFGRLADFHVLDTRQYRTDQPCGDKNGFPCPEVYDPKGTLLGPRQRRWLFKGLERSSATWNVLAQQVMMARVDRAPGEAIAHSMDQWPGYEMERRAVLKHFHEKRIANPVVLTGDIHTHWANELIADFDQLDSRVVATEFVGSSMTTGGNGNKNPKNLHDLHAENPFVKYYSAERGYVACQVTPREWRADFRCVDFIDKPHSPIGTRASYLVESGRPGLNRV